MACCFNVLPDISFAQSNSWNYKGSQVELIEAGSAVTIRFIKLGVAFDGTGANAGDVVFRGARAGNRLSGTAYRFYGARCGSIGFPVEGSITDNERIVLAGIAPSLGVTSCNQSSTFYDTLLFTRDATAPQETTRASTALLPAANRSPVYLLYPFRCEIINGEPRFIKTGEFYYHEALDYRAPQTYSICGPGKADWGESSFLTACQQVSLTSLRLVCKDGIIGAPQLTQASEGKRSQDARVEGDHLLYPIYNTFRDSDAPSRYQSLPSGWAPIPQPRALLASKDFPILSGTRRIPVSGQAETVLPDSFFLALLNIAPIPHLLAFPILLAAAAFASFGFYLVPDSKLSPRSYGFWVWLLIAAVGLNAALLTGSSISDALNQGQAQARAIEADQAKLDALFPSRDGHLQPFTKNDLDLAARLLQPRTITSAAEAANGIGIPFFLYLTPALLFLIVYARFAFAGYHYLFVRHPAEAVTAPALNTGELFDKKRLVGALRGDPHELADHPPVHRTWNLLRRARLLREKIEADTDLAEAAMRRDRARAAQKEAERELREARKKLSWWERLLAR